MPRLTSKIEQLQRAVADRVGRLQALRQAKVFIDRSSSLDEKFDEKLTPKLGLSILVRRPSLAAGSLTAGVVTFDNVVMTLRIVENLLTNTSGIDAPLAAEILIKDLSGWSPPGVTTPLAPRPTYPWFQQVGTPTTNVVEIILTTSYNL